MADHAADTLRKEALVAVKVTPERKALYRREAAREGLRLSEWLRRLADYRLAEREQMERLALR